MVKKLILWILFGALLLSLLAPAYAAPRAVVAEGIDVSYAQGEINWDTVAKHVDFVIIRCGYGQDRTSQDDEQWFRNADACTRLGIPFGVYLYSYATTDDAARSEAAHVLRLVKKYKISLPIFLDVEDIYIQNNCSKEDILRHVTIFCEIIAEAGYTPGVYSNANFWKDYMPSSEYCKWERWVAQWNNPVHESRPYCAWQYTCEGKVPGINGYVDRDYWYGEQIKPECSHDYSRELVREATCTGEGLAKYTCSRCGRSYEESIPKTDHKYSSPETVKTPTCTEEGLIKYTCSGCSKSYEEKIPKAEHRYSCPETVKEPTCAEDGVKKYTCTGCYKTYEDRIPAKGHDYTATVVPPSSGHGGYTLYECACGHSYTESNGGCQEHACDSGIITKMPTETEGGTKIFCCIHCGEYMWSESLDSISAHRKECPSASYVDVPPYLHWAHEGIDLCLVEGLFRGLDEGHFDPNGAMTRAMMVVVIWRLEGCPKASKFSSFTDVVPYAWYADAVAWAQEEGIVNGLGDGRFGPLERVTREQIVAILYRNYLRHAINENTPLDILKEFPDEQAVNDYARNAFAWALNNGYIFGTSENGKVLLAPQDTATRGQVATIMRRLPR